jgi:nucleotide-binding universal stress UspA family protein
MKSKKPAPTPVFHTEGQPGQSRYLNRELSLLAFNERVLAMDATVEAWSRQRLDEEVGHLKAQVPAGIEVRQRLLWGTHPVDTIESAAVEHDWHLIVVGTHGKGTVTRWVVGSVAIGLCQGAPCPVLVMPPR